MSKTPQTDAEAMDGEFRDQGSLITLRSWDYKKDRDGEVVPAEFARELETELEAAKARIEELEGAIREFRRCQEWASVPWKEQAHVRALYACVEEALSTKRAQ